MSLSVVFILFIWLGWVQYLNDLNLWVVVFPQFVKISCKCFFSPIFSSNLDSHCTFVTLLDTVLQIIEASFFFPTCFSLDDFWSLPILSFVASDLLFMQIDLHNLCFWNLLRFIYVAWQKIMSVSVPQLFENKVYSLLFGYKGHYLLLEHTCWLYY